MESRDVLEDRTYVEINMMQSIDGKTIEIFLKILIMLKD